MSLPKSFQPDGPEDAPKSFQPDTEEAPTDYAGIGKAVALGAIPLGFGDEVAGAQTGAMQAITNILPQSIRDKLDLVQAPAADAYRYSRDDARQIEAAHPTAYGISSGVSNTALSLAVPGAQTLAGSAALGAMAGLGNSDADVTRGDYSDALQDTAVGGALGVGSHLLGQGVSKGVGAVKNFAQGRVTDASDAALRTARAELEAANASAKGQAGAQMRGAISGLERARERMTPEQYKLFLSDLERHEPGLYEELIQRGRAAAKSDVMEVANNRVQIPQVNDDAVQALANQKLQVSPGDMGRDALARAKAAVVQRLARSMPGKAAAFVRDQVKSPGGQKLIYGGVEKVMSRAQSGGPYAQALLDAYSRSGEQGVGALHFVLMQRDQNYRQQFSAGQDQANQ